MSLDRPDSPRRPDRSLSHRSTSATYFDLLSLGQEADNGGIQIARTFSHHQPLQRCEPHRRFDQPALCDRPRFLLTTPWNKADRLVSAPVGSTTSTRRNLIEELPLLMTKTCMSTLKSHGMRHGVVSHRASPTDPRPPSHPTSCLPSHWCMCLKRQHCCISPGDRRPAGLFLDSLACHARLQSLDPEAL